MERDIGWYFNDVRYRGHDDFNLHILNLISNFQTTKRAAVLQDELIPLEFQTLYLYTLEYQRHR